MASGKLKDHQLEKKLGDCARAVTVRRSLFERRIGRSMENLPKEVRNVKSVIQCPPLPLCNENQEKCRTRARTHYVHVYIAFIRTRVYTAFVTLTKCMPSNETESYSLSLCTCASRINYSYVCFIHLCMGYVDW